MFKMVLMNKKGMTLNEVLGLVVGVAAVVILMFLAVGMYNLFIQPGIIEQAKATLRGLVAEISGLEEGGEGSYMVLNPEDWSLISDGNTLYLCDIQGTDFSDSGKVRRNALQLCITQNIFEKFENEIKIDHDCFAKTIDSCLLLKEFPVELFLRKENGTIHISTESQSVGQGGLEDVLEFKSKSSKTIQELIFEYLDSRENGDGEKIKEALRDYFSGFDSEKETGIKEENFIWTFDLIGEVMQSGGEPLYGRFFSVSSHTFARVGSWNEFSSVWHEFDYGGKKYTLEFGYYDKGK